MKVNKQKIKTEYFNILESYREDIKTLDASDRSDAIDWLTVLSDSTKYIETKNSDPEMQNFMNSLSGAHKFFDNDDI